MIESAIHALLDVLSVPEIGLTAVFLISFFAATLLPIGSEPVVFAVAQANPFYFWPVIFVATAGNTLGGIVNYWLGYGAHAVFAKERESRWFTWLERFGAKTMLFAWLPIIGDLICSLAGWLKLPFWPSVFYMALGKFVRYLLLLCLLLRLPEIPDGFWRQVAQWFL